MQKHNFRSDIILDYKEAEFGKVVSLKGVSKMPLKQPFDRTRIVLKENNKYGKNPGEYITLNYDYAFIDACGRQKFTSALAKEIKRLVGKAEKILCIGIGNSSIVSDSLGPSVINQLQFFKLDKDIPGLKTFCPNVVGNTGIDSFKIIKLLVSEVKPDIVLVIDSLCSRAFSRIGSSFQISTGGIVPGSGVGTNNIELTKKTLGRKVIAIGVPMVVYLKSLLFEILGSLELPDKIDILKMAYDDIYVSPKEIDLIVKECSNVICEAIKKIYV